MVCHVIVADVSLIVIEDILKLLTFKINSF